jgi:hypothetical protein
VRDEAMELQGGIMNTPANNQDYYFIIREVEAAHFLNEGEQKQLLTLLAQLEQRRHWWGYQPTEFIVLERTFGGNEPEWTTLESAAKASAKPPLTYVRDFPKGIRTGKFRDLGAGYGWGMSLEDAMATYPGFWEGDKQQYDKKRNGTPNEGTEQQVNTTIPLAGDSAETAFQSQPLTCLEGMASGQSTLSTNGDNAAL